MKFEHAACGQVVAEFVGKGKPRPGMIVRNIDWKLAGEQPAILTGLNFLCPYCNEIYRLGPADLREVKEPPTITVGKAERLH